MEFIGIMAFILLISNMGLPGKVKKLNADVKRMKRLMKEEGKMSQILKDLKGKNCTIETEETFNETIHCEVLDIDDEWMKISYTDKKNEKKIKIIRIEDINNISLE
jgi:hypothetical protein